MPLLEEHRVSIPAVVDETAARRELRRQIADLERQLGHLAARNSCQGPWTSNATLNLSFNPVKFRMPYRANLSLQVANPLGAADLLVAAILAGRIDATTPVA